MQPNLITTEPPPSDSTAQLELLVARQRRNDTIQSLVVAVIVIVLIGAVLWLIAILPRLNDADTIVTYQPVTPPEENPVEKPDMANAVKPKPSSSSSSMARVIAASVEAPVAVPMPEESNPTVPFGTDDDFAAGFGSGDGDGDGGGGSSFFGTPRKGRRVVYVVDYSESMMSDAEGGGTRMDALKKELTRSVRALKQGMNFNVIFFSQTAWTIETDGPNQANNGWNGLNETPPVPWYPASDHIKKVFEEKIGEMKPGLGTVWYSPLKMALSMSPPPEIIYLLSDGEPSDLNDVLNRIDGMNPTGVPIDTFAMEEPGEEARAMSEMAKETGGRFTMIYKGRAYSGMGAEKYTTGEFDE
ncbi:hypothetical protein HAHE_34580 [Haloferula helveola]|uniref:VWFA domain-containing protein n=1 Tax=Haloferula helveola TaxID=490095 RepID=A0ABM7RI10_9BACT|nr:hypothetical protein HAHE_34580 [Haloferula helveola]